MAEGVGCPFFSLTADAVGHFNSIRKRPSLPVKYKDHSQHERRLGPTRSQCGDVAANDLRPSIRKIAPTRRPNASSGFGRLVRRRRSTKTLKIPRVRRHRGHAQPTSQFTAPSVLPYLMHPSYEPSIGKIMQKLAPASSSQGHVDDTFVKRL